MGACASFIINQRILSISVCIAVDWTSKLSAQLSSSVLPQRVGAFSSLLLLCPQHLEQLLHIVGAQ